jgi:putative membrane-bound dehydrogenase-like protein
MNSHKLNQFLPHTLIGIIVLSSMLCLNSCTEDEKHKVLEIEPQSSIVFIGNTFIDRMQLFGHFESFLQSQFPSHQLKIRNMGWPADEVALRPRPSGFGNMHRYIAEEKADIIFASYGLNESFKGADSLQAFSKNLKIWLNDLKSHQYNGKSTPTIVLISPMAHEALEKLPNGVEHNKDLGLYTNAMREVASELEVTFVDLFSPTLEYINSKEQKKLTYNGIHLSAYGDWRVSHMMVQSLFHVDDLPTTIKLASENSRLKDLARTIYDKNYTYLQYWRGPNMEYVYGSRKEAGGATGVDLERRQLIHITEQLDSKIWASSKPQVDAIWNTFPLDGGSWTSTPTYEGIEIPEHLKEKLNEPLVGDEKAGEILSIEKALNAFHLPDGYEISLYASEQDFPLANPMAMNFDSKGRLWVANTPTWPQPKPGVQPEDFIVILEDSDKNGKADKHTIFMDKLNMIHGFALGFDGVFISQTPNIIFAKDTNGDDVADSVETIMQGFGAEDAEHSINNLTWGPDGGLYFLNGIFFHSQIETPYGPVRLKDAGVFRYEPRLQKLDTYLSDFFWNPWGLAFDQTGQGILLDASSGDFYNMKPMAANFNYPKIKYSCCSPNDGPQDHPIHESISFAPDGVGPAAGIGIIQNSHFPKEAQGRFVSNQIEGWRGTHWYDMTEKGTNFELKQLTQELIFSEDKHFRPVAMNFGPDGALYILDFYSPIFENVDFPKRTKGRDHSHGRIWRITYPSKPLLEYPRFDIETTENLLDLLKSYEAPIRFHTRRELQERKTNEVVEVLEKWVSALDKNDKEYEQFALEALWIYEGHHYVNEALINELLEAKSDKIRAEATNILRYWQCCLENPEQLIEKMVNDQNMRVRLEAVIACGFSSSPSAYAIAAQAANYTMDDGMKHALDQTLTFLKVQKPSKSQSLKLTSSEELLSMEISESIAYELLIRDDSEIPKSNRLDALTYLSKTNKTTFSFELIKALQEVVDKEEINSDNEENYALIDLTAMLLSRDPEELSTIRKEMELLISSLNSPHIKGAVYMAMMLADKDVKATWQLARSSETNLVTLMNSINLLPDDELKKGFYDLLSGQLKSSSQLLRESAINALAHIPLNFENTFEKLEAISSNTKESLPIRFAALNGLAKLPEGEISKKIERVIKIEIGVIPSKMEFDIKEFNVPAGAPIEITFTNSGFQLHNMLICMPDQLEFVAKAAEAMSTQSDALDKHYTPEIKEVLFATPMIGAKKSYKLQFFAPQEPGIYPYVCTFPGHWRMMNGTMTIEKR